MGAEFSKHDSCSLSAKEFAVTEADRHQVAIIGAGPAGLAAAAALRAKGVRPTVFERGDDVGSSWRRHYDRLHLHTVRWLSGLPGMAIPRAEGPWVSRDGVIRYLEAYTAYHGIDVRTGVTVEKVARAPEGWVLRSSLGDEHADAVIVATGYNHTPVLPDVPGIDDYTGELLHASDYRNGRPYAGKDVLVVGPGNTGAEIAVDLVEHGAGRVRLAVRTPPYLLRRALGPIPTQLTGVALRRVPAAIADRLAEIGRKFQVPDLSDKGLPDPGPGLVTRARRGQIPILDVGLIDAVRVGKVEPVAALAGFDGEAVRLTDGSVLTPDAVIIAAGYRRGLEDLVGHLGVLDARGHPRVHGRTTRPDAPGLHFIGYTNPLSGMFREIAIDAKRIASSVSASAVTTA
ncbi:MAG: SidA/IucD/PvdA family monooxygenase [Actinophytocola sp.]|nr:SidA/IucD/PvdA family monooxygenase [Actinophytocola sp.]